jgi:hypothetical protein
MLGTYFIISSSCSTKLYLAKHVQSPYLFFPLSISVFMLYPSLCFKSYIIALNLYAPNSVNASPGVILPKSFMYFTTLSFCVIFG